MSIKKIQTFFDINKNNNKERARLKRGWSHPITHHTPNNRIRGCMWWMIRFWVELARGGWWGKGRAKRVSTYNIQRCGTRVSRMAVEALNRRRPEYSRCEGEGGANSFELLARRVESGWMGEARAGAGAGAWWAGSLKSCSINAAGGGGRIPGR